MPLGTEVGLGPGHIVLYGTQLPLPKGAQQPPPLFDPCLLWRRSPISATAELLSMMTQNGGWPMPRRVRGRYPESDSARDRIVRYDANTDWGAHWRHLPNTI